MTEGGAMKTKRNGARVFKNPPQPHMCIQDYMQGSDLPCYVNVLSWDKVAMPCNLAQTIPLYGGMRVSPPRGEKPEVGVFAVIANPELLKLYGKNSPDPKERSTLIELLLNFVETKNEGVYFSRQYTVLKDRDITGELKEVWMAVQAKRDRENLAPQQETWIDAQPPAPQYPQYSDQQQQSQQQQLQPPPQQQHIDYAQPPQYRSNAAYSTGSVSNNEVNHEREIRFSYDQQNPVVTQSDQVYQSRSVIVQPYAYDGSVIPQDRCYNYRERGRPDIPQNPTQQNCPAYPAPQYQFQQLPRQMVPQYVNSNMHINANPNYNMGGNQNFKMNLNCPSKFQEYMMMQQQVTEQRQLDNAMHADAHRIQQHQIQQQQIQQQQQVQQQQQIQQRQHQIQQQQHQQPINQPTTQYQPQQPHQRQTQQNHQIQHQPQPDQQMQTNDTRSRNALKPVKQPRPRPHMGVAQKSNASKRQIDSPTHSKQASCSTCQTKEPSETPSKPKSPVKVLQRDSGSQEKQNATQNMGERNESTSEKSEGSEIVWHSKNVDVSEKMRRGGYVLRFRNRRRETRNVLNDSVTTNNGTKTELNQLQNSEPGRLSKQEKGVEEELIQTLSEIETQLHLAVPQLGRNDLTNKKTDSPKRTQTTVNSIISSVFKMNPRMNGSEAGEKRKGNSQAKNTAKTISNDQDEAYHQAYTILKKPEASTTSGESNVPTSSGLEEEISTKLAQISIEDCKDATEVNAVLS